VYKPYFFVDYDVEAGGETDTSGEELMIEVERGEIIFF
jgi:hypothetical protein